MTGDLSKLFYTLAILNWLVAIYIVNAVFLLKRKFLELEIYQVLNEQGPINVAYKTSVFWEASLMIIT
jgi:hypothetical protein